MGEISYPATAFARDHPACGLARVLSRTASGVDPALEGSGFELLVPVS
jgi:hypothetical protein